MKQFSRVGDFLIRISIVIVFLAFAGSAVPQPSAGAAAAPVVWALPAVRGSQPFLTILCKFADVPGEPHSPASFERLVTGPAPSLDDYWREASYGAIDLAGSKVTSWKTLPLDLAGYRTPATGPGVVDGVDTKMLALHCLKAASTEVQAGSYTGYNLVFNADLVARPYSGQVCADGICRKVSWIWPAQHGQLGAWAHEIGHVFGLSHTVDGGGQPYNDTWSLMSRSSYCSDGEGRTEVPQHLSGLDKDRLGWIPPARRFVASPDATAIVTLERLARPGARNYLLAVVPFGESGAYYTVEARQRVSYDAHLPGAAVVIHSFDPADAEHPALVIVHPGDPRPTDAAAAWLPGETYRDVEHWVAITVEAGTASGFTLKVRTGRDAEDSAPGGVSVAPVLHTVQRVSIAAPDTYAIAMGVAPGTTYLTWAAEENGFSALHTCSRSAGKAQTEPEASKTCWNTTRGDSPQFAVADGRIVLGWSGWSQQAVYPDTRSAISPDFWLASPVADVWAPAVRLSSNGEHPERISPVLAAGRSGRLAAAWLEQATRAGDVSEVRFALLTPGSEVAGSERINDVDDGAWRTSPSLVVDGGGNAYVAWVDARSGWPEIYAAVRDTDGSWGRNVKLSEGVHEENAAPALAVDEAGNVYAVWISYSDCTRGSQSLGTIRLAVKPASGDWGPAEVVAEVDGGRETRPVIATGPAGVYLAWEAYFEGKVTLFLNHRGPGGSGAAPARIAATGTHAPITPAVAVDASGRVHLSWVAGEGAERTVEYATNPD